VVTQKFDFPISNLLHFGHGYVLLGVPGVPAGCPRFFFKLSLNGCRLKAALPWA